METEHAATLLLVDDETIMTDILTSILKERYRILVAHDGGGAMRLAREGAADLVLLDVMMPVMSGFEVCRALKEDPRTSGLPVIFLTGQDDAVAETLGFRLGAVDYITKPFNPEGVKARIATHLALANQQRHLELLVRQRTRELEEQGREIIHGLGRASELRDCETGQHVARVSNYAYLIARSAGLPPEQAELIRTVAPLHDVGKIGVPDHILLKPGAPTPEEWIIIKSHCELGYRIIGEHDDELLRTAALCAYSHHERWDGSGYPRGLKGEAIPLVARILAVADVFDALTCERPYKLAWPFDAAVAEVTAGSGSQFDPFIIDAFVNALPRIERVRQESFRGEQTTGTAPCPTLSAA